MWPQNKHTCTHTVGRETEIDRDILYWFQIKLGHISSYKPSFFFLWILILRQLGQWINMRPVMVMLLRSYGARNYLSYPSNVFRPYCTWQIGRSQVVQRTELTFTSVLSLWHSLNYSNMCIYVVNTFVTKYLFYILICVQFTVYNIFLYLWL